MNTANENCTPSLINEMYKCLTQDGVISDSKSFTALQICVMSCKRLNLARLVDPVDRIFFFFK